MYSIILTDDSSVTLDQIASLQFNCNMKTLKAEQNLDIHELLHSGCTFIFILLVEKRNQVGGPSNNG